MQFIGEVETFTNTENWLLDPYMSVNITTNYTLVQTYKVVNCPDVTYTQTPYTIWSSHDSPYCISEMHYVEWLWPNKNAMSLCMTTFNTHTQCDLVGYHQTHNRNFAVQIHDVVRCYGIRKRDHENWYPVYEANVADPYGKILYIVKDNKFIRISPWAMRHIPLRRGNVTYNWSYNVKENRDMTISSALSTVISSSVRKSIHLDVCVESLYDNSTYLHENMVSHIIDSDTTNYFQYFFVEFCGKHENVCNLFMQSNMLFRLALSLGLTSATKPKSQKFYYPPPGGYTYILLLDQIHNHFSLSSGKVFNIEGAVDEVTVLENVVKVITIQPDVSFNTSLLDDVYDISTYHPIDYILDDDSLSVSNICKEVIKFVFNQVSHLLGETMVYNMKATMLIFASLSWVFPSSIYIPILGSTYVYFFIL